jgi:hypothetical protein
MPRRAQTGNRGLALLILDLGARREGCLAPRPGRFTSGKDPVSIVQEAGWDPGLVWTCAKNLAPTEIRHRTVQSVASRCTDWATRPKIYIIAVNIFFFPQVTQQLQLVHSLSTVQASRSYSDTPQSVSSSGRVISPARSPPPDHTQHYLDRYTCIPRESNSQFLQTSGRKPKSGYGLVNNHDDNDDDNNNINFIIIINL